MNAILGMTAIATTHIDDRERVLDCLKKIGLSSNHLLSLINDVLVCLNESGKLSLETSLLTLLNLLPILLNWYVHKPLLINSNSMCVLM